VTAVTLISKVIGMNIYQITVYELGKCSGEIVADNFNYLL